MTKHIAAADLDIAYEEWGGGDRVVLLLHGFPDDAKAWTGVATALPPGVRAIAPYVRGFGPTRFKSTETIRTGQKAAQLADLVAFMDALGIARAVVLGHDWGQGTAQALAFLHPQRVQHLISLGDYALTFERSGRPSLRQLWAFRFHLLANTGLAEAVLKYRREWLARRLWRNWSPRAGWDEAAFQSMSPSLANPDFVAVVLSAYRQMSGKGARDPRYDDLDLAIARGPEINVPTTMVRSMLDGLTLFDAERGPSPKFKHLNAVVDLPTGHWPHREMPARIAELVINCVPLTKRACAGTADARDDQLNTE